MPSPVESSLRTRSAAPQASQSFPPQFTLHSGLHKLVFVGLLAAMGVVFSLFEMYIPKPLPWAKPGLGNLATLLALYILGWRAAFAVSILRVVITNLWSGGFGGPAFALAIVAAVAAAGAMAVVLAGGAIRVGPVGISTVGAFTHVMTQLLCAGVFFVGKWQVIRLLPWFVVPAFFAGLVVGVAAYFLLKRLQSLFVFIYPLPQFRARAVG